MEVKELTFSYKEVLHTVKATDINKLVNYKMNQLGFYKCSDIAEKENVTRSAISQRIADNPGEYETVEYGGFLYAKKK